MAGNITSSPPALLTGAALAVLIAVLFLIIAIVTALSVIKWWRIHRNRARTQTRGRSDRQSPGREGFANGDGDMLRVLHIAPAHELKILHNPSVLSLAPDALKPLERFSDAGVRTVVRRSTDDSLSPPVTTKSEPSLFTVDAMRLQSFIEADGTPRSKRPRAFAALPSPANDQHFVVIGSAPSLPPESMQAEEDDEAHDHRLTVLLEALRGDHDVQFVCRDASDVRTMTLVLAASGAMDAEGIVESLIRPRLRFVDTLEAMGQVVPSEQPVVLFTFMGKASPMWGRLKEAEVVWYSYADDPKFDMTRVKHVMPYAFKVDLNIQMELGEMEELKGDRFVYGHLTVHSFLAGPAELEDHPLMLVTAIAMIYSEDGDTVRTQNTATANNLMAMYFTYYEATRKVLARFNRNVYRRRLHSGTDGNEFYTDGVPREVVTGKERGLRIGRPRLNILEQFDQGQGQGPSLDPSQGRARGEDGDEEIDRTDLDTRYIHVKEGFALSEEQDGVHRGDDDIAGKPLTINVHEPVVNGFVDFVFRQKVRRVRALYDGPLPVLRGIPVRAWDRIILKNQTHRHLNGRFYVTSIDMESKIITLMDAIVMSFRDGTDKLIEDRTANDDPIRKVDVYMSNLEGLVSDVHGAHHGKSRSRKEERGTGLVLDLQTGIGFRRNRGRGVESSDAVALNDSRLNRRLRSLSTEDVVFFENIDTDGVHASPPGTSPSSSSSDDRHNDMYMRLLLAPTPDPEEEEWTDSKFFCLTDERVQNPAQCESLNGGRGIWDRPCRENTECPFFQVNKRYPNYRGGCDDSGFCEMPLGVQRRGFRSYDAERSRPLCYSCPDPLDRDCCVKQSPHPDYAFPLDEFDRRDAGIDDYAYL